MGSITIIECFNCRIRHTMEEHEWRRMSFALFQSRPFRCPQCSTEFELSRFRDQFHKEFDI